jgi:glycine/D-amino acid oxidase-like deaminating enzyme
MASYPLDHLTRFIHRLGPQLGPEVWSINQLGFKEISDYCLDQEISIKFGTQRCDALSEPEFGELKIFDHQARSLTRIPQSQMQLNTTLGNMPTHGSLIHHTGSSAWIETKDLARHLLAQIAHYPRLPAIARLDSDAEGISLTCSSPTLRVKAEIVIVACHIKTAEILPDLDPILINLVDQWDEFEFTDSRPSLSLKPGDFFKLNYGQTWGMITPDLKLRVGGSRFLRGEKADSIQAKDNPFKEGSHSKKISTFHTKICHQIASPSSSHIRSQTFVDILPCDELPIIGPMYNDSRVLLATGFYGFGLPLVSLAGQWLAQIIDQGKAPALLPCFLPNRLRSLSDYGS